MAPQGQQGEADLDLWLKDVAPSTEAPRLVRAPAGAFAGFRERYLAGLADNPAVGQLTGQRHDPALGARRRAPGRRAARVPREPAGSR
ncbi:MAG: hypothetical protein R2717_07920 [Schumannella sp.]